MRSKPNYFEVAFFLLLFFCLVLLIFLPFPKLRKCWSKRMLGLKRFRSKRFVGPTKSLVQKMLGPYQVQKVWVKQNSSPKKSLVEKMEYGPKKIWPLKDRSKKVDQNRVVAAEISLIQTNVAWTNVAWRNVTVTVSMC